MTVAQTDLSFDPMLVTQVLLFIGVLAGAVKGTQYLVKQAIAGKKWGFRRWAERKRRDQLLDHVLSPTGWPNGAQNIVEAHKDIYDLAKRTASTVDQMSVQVDQIQATVEQIADDRKVG